jgi:predicted RNase H-like HicB family nuclease
MENTTTKLGCMRESSPAFPASTPASTLYKLRENLREVIELCLEVIENL